MAALVSDQTLNYGTESFPDIRPVSALADFRSTDLELGTTVTHLAGASMYGSVSKLCVLNRVCRELALDILFKAGVVRLRALTVQSRPRGRGEAAASRRLHRWVRQSFQSCLT